MADYGVGALEGELAQGKAQMVNNIETRGTGKTWHHAWKPSGRDSSLESLSFTVNSAINSSHMAVRTVELASNMIPIAWAWKVNEDGDVEYA